MPSHSRAVVHHKVDDGLTSKPEVAQSTHTRVLPACGCDQSMQRGKTSMQCDNFSLEKASLPANTTTGHFPSVPEDGNEPPWETTTVSPQQSRSLGRRTAPHSAPPSSGTPGENQEGCVDRGERQGTAALLHKPEVLPHSGDSIDSLNSAVCSEIPLPTETPLPGRGSVRRC